MALLLLGAAHGAESRTLVLETGTEVPLDVHPARGEAMILWLPSEHGQPAAENEAAAALAAAGVEVWLADLLAAHFLPVAPSALDQVPPEDVSALVTAAHRETGKTVYLLAAGRGAALALQGARRWQLAEPDGTALAGVLLLFPDLYVQTPEPGQRAQYRPIARATNLPVFVVQPALSPWRWQLDRLSAVLQEGGSPVYLRLLPGLRDRYYFRPDATPEEVRAAAQLPATLHAALPLLAAVAGARAAAPLASQSAPDAAPGGRTEHALRAYRGDPQPPPLSLPLLQGGRTSLDDHRGQVVLVNFWASWCPPCVHEMPSMQRLADAFAGRPFRILAVNMAEEPGTVREFLHSKVRVDFPILLDAEGEALRAWQVFAFPTSYLIDRRGRIRYAVFGAIDWDAPAVIETVRKLLEAD